MNRNRRNKGFTLAETLLVAAIIVILAAVAFIAVSSHLRSTERFELDGIAKEIFVAAQNHLSMADSQGLLAQRAEAKRGVSSSEINEYYKDKSGLSVTPDVRYFVAPSASPIDPDSVLSLMLPMAAVDETVRLGGSYIILYDYATATVLDVFYAERSGGRFAYTFPSDITALEIKALLNSYADTVDGDGKTVSHRENRQKYQNDHVIGWYGGADANGLKKVELLAPSFTITNGDRLYVTVTNPNVEIAGSPEINLTLTVRGHAKNGDPVEYTFDLSGTAKEQDFVLDDITSATDRFHTRCPNIVPGTDVEIVVTATPTNALGRPVVAGPQTTNSLFADVNGGVAEIASFRHLENLEKLVSGFDPADAAVTGAKQTCDLDWTAYITNPELEDDTILDRDGGAALIKNLDAGHYYPVNLQYTESDGVTPRSFDYDGQKHSVSKVLISYPSDVGLFGTVANSTVRNLELLDFSVQSESNSATHGAGALAGVASNATITNVLARTTGTTAPVSVSGPDVVGGLVGIASATSIENCAAALRVASTGDKAAGGLVGKATGATSFTGCYSGGHTTNGEYSTAAYDVVSASGAAGGFVGDANGATITGCYSTCSVSGATAGGLAGEAHGAIKNSYATGLVDLTATAKGALIGVASDGTNTASCEGCYYYMIINELPDYSCLGPVGGAAYGGVTALDDDQTEYNDFLGKPGNWIGANPTDSILQLYYKGSYPLKGIDRLAPSPDLTDCFVAEHYGDWPAPELRVVNPAAPAP